MAITSDYYPDAAGDRVAWHANFSAQATLIGTTYGLSAAQVTQIAADAANVALLVNAATSIDTARQAFTAWKDTILSGPLNVALPANPGSWSAPSLTTPATAIQARTRQYANIIKASTSYSTEIGERYGIIAAGPASYGTPSLVATPLPAGGVKLKIAKAGYSVLVIDSRRGGGAW